MSTITKPITIEDLRRCHECDVAVEQLYRALTAKDLALVMQVINCARLDHHETPGEAADRLKFRREFK